MTTTTSHIRKDVTLTKLPTKLFVDGDILLFKASSATEELVKFDDDYWILGASESSTIDAFDRLCTAIHEMSMCEEMVICLSDSQNFRKELEPTYKQNRKGSRKPLLYSRLRDYAEKHYDCISYPRLEGDDVIGVSATSYEGRYIIHSEDKDLKQIPGTHMDLDGNLTTVTEEEGIYFHALQTLTGDPTDGYAGAKGVGKVKAEKALSDAPNGLWEAIVKTYESVGMTEEEALLQARLAYILRKGDYHFEKRGINLWKP